MTDTELTELAERIYWKIEHGRSPEAVKLLRELIEKVIRETGL